MNEEVAKRGPGRPKKEEAAPAKPGFTFKAKPNWEDINPELENSPDRLRIPAEMIPEGYSLQWVVDSVLGQDMGQQRSVFEQGGWTPTHQSDFDGRFDGMFMQRGKEGEIKYEGLVLMYRPIEITQKVQAEERRRAREQIEIKERALRGGELPNVSLDAQHKSALQTNKIGKSYERIAVPKD